MNSKYPPTRPGFAAAGTLLFLLAAIGCLTISTASAKANVASSDPAEGSSAPVGLRQVVITFTEAIDVNQSTAQLLVLGQQAVEGATTSVSPTDPRRMTIQASSPLAEGRYTVRWHVLSVSDSTRTDGEINFAVGNPPPAPQATLTPQAPAPTPQATGGSAPPPTQPPASTGTGQTSPASANALIWLLLAIIVILLVMVVVQRIALGRRP